MIHPSLTRRDKNIIPEDRAEIRLFSVMQNEELRLPYYFDYYRRMGVARFFVIDNGSKDGTPDFLMAQPDCHVFHTAENYAYSRFGVDWLNTLMDSYGDGHWIILADADELLVYPHCEQKPLRKFCEWMDARGDQGIYVTLLDMYSDEPLSRVNYKKGGDFRLTCDRFDKDYHFVPRLGIPFLRPAFPKLEPIGGPRLRLCFPRQNTPRLWPRLRIKLTRRLLNLIHKAGFLKDIEVENAAPQAFKIPLVKWQRGYGFITSHRLNPIRLASVTGAFLHFKYFQDFSGRVKDAVTRGNHYDGSAEYKRYAELMTADPDLSMTYAGSAQYRSSDDLLRAGIIKSVPDWDDQ